MNRDKSVVDKDLYHFRTRATGQLYMGPIQAQGYDNRVLEFTLNEMEFKNSKEAAGFLDTRRRKYANTGQLCRDKQLKYISRGDEF
jgi:hypothetical protein